MGIRDTDAHKDICLNYKLLWCLYSLNCGLGGLDRVHGRVVVVGALVLLRLGK